MSGDAKLYAIIWCIIGVVVLAAIGAMVVVHSPSFCEETTFEARDYVKCSAGASITHEEHGGRDFVVCVCARRP